MPGGKQHGRPEIYDHAKSGQDVGIDAGGGNGVHNFVEQPAAYGTNRSSDHDGELTRTRQARAR